MDFNEYWQENKRFLTTVGAGLLVFMILNMIVEGMYASDIQSVQRTTSANRKKLKDAMYTADDRAMAEGENAALLERYGMVADVAAFEPRTGFVLDAREASPQNVYISAVESVRDRMTDLASRKRAFLPDGLDLEMVKTRNVDAIERNLHAVDLLERALVMALESGVRQVKSVEVRLDPAFRSRRGVGAIERTQVTIDALADSESVTRWLAMTQTPVDEGGALSVRRAALPIEALEMRRANSKADEVRTRVTFLVVRVHEILEDDGDDA